jgi:hypothetical protein
MHSLRSHDGYLLTDQRACYVPPSDLLGLGRFKEVATYRCWHCGGHMILDPPRSRPPEYCRLCDENICHECDGIRREADYEHISFDEMVEMVRSGKWALAPGSTSRRPILIQLPPPER